MMISTIGPGAASPSPAGKAPTGKAAGTFGEALEAAEQARAPRLADQLPPLFKYGTPGKVTLADIARERDEEYATLTSQLRTRLSALGIDTSRRFELGIGADGHAIVRGEHPDKAKIEALFREEPALRDRLAKVMSLSNFIQRGEEAIAFQKAYAKDPQAAVAQFAHLFSGRFEEAFFLAVVPGRGGWDFELASEQRLKLG